MEGVDAKVEGAGEDSLVGVKVNLLADYLFYFFTYYLFFIY